MRNPLLFLAALLLSLTAGRAFWITLGENPFNMSGATYVEFFQQLDQRIAVPIAITGIGGTLLAGLSGWLHRRDRQAFYLLFLACGIAAISDLVTIVVNVPINNRVATWNPLALPPDYKDYLLRWWQWHQVRLATMMTATCCVFIAMLVRQPSRNELPPSRRDHGRQA